MSKITKLSRGDQLPLTCSRTGTCCHGKKVWINPWELARLAEAKGISTAEFRDLYCDFGGIRLSFTGTSTWKGLSACSMYIPDFGCSVHEGRPFACRLYPLGLQRQGDEKFYMHQGVEFPCMDGCPEVEDLPYFTVDEYIEGQKAQSGEVGQDEYLKLMESLADGAFALLIESGLAEMGNTETLQLWRSLGNAKPKKLAKRIGAEWVDQITIPQISECSDPAIFAKAHHDLIQEKAQVAFGSLDSVESFQKGSVLMMGLALYLGRALGADHKELAEHWIATAKEHGAQE